MFMCFVPLQPPPAPRIRSKMDSLILTSDSIKAINKKEPSPARKDVLSVHQSGKQDMAEDVTENETEVEVEAENVERPVDLYKVLF